MKVSSPTSVLEVCQLDPDRLSIAGSCVQLDLEASYFLVCWRGDIQGEIAASLLCLSLLLNVSMLAESVIS